MGETLVPTMSFRWLVPNVVCLSVQPTAKRLQQMFWKGTQQIWMDVPIVFEDDMTRPLPTGGSGE